MTKAYRAVGIFPNYQETETVLQNFKKKGFLLDKVYVVSLHKDPDSLKNLKYQLTEYNSPQSSWTAIGILPGLLWGLKIPSKRAKMYRTKVTEGGCLVIIEGLAGEIKKVEDYLIQQGIPEWDVCEILENPSNLDRHLRILGTFPNLLKTKTALMKLIDTGYPMNQVTLFIADDDRHDWFPNLKVCGCLDSRFSLLPEAKKVFFQDCFALGEYILMIDGGESEIHRAETVLKLEDIQGLYAFNS